jgi:hypothetical protein
MSPTYVFFLTTLRESCAEPARFDFISLIQGQQITQLQCENVITRPLEDHD